MTIKIYDQLIGKIFNNVISTGEELKFIGNERYQFSHWQDCCESVFIEDICGDLSDLENSPILEAEEVSNIDTSKLKIPSLADSSYTWTFYKFRTVKGSVTVR